MPQDLLLDCGHLLARFGQPPPTQGPLQQRVCLGLQVYLRVFRLHAIRLALLLDAQLPRLHDLWLLAAEIFGFLQIHVSTTQDLSLALQANALSLPWHLAANVQPKYFSLEARFLVSQCASAVQ